MVCLMCETLLHRVGVFPADSDCQCKRCVLKTQHNHSEFDVAVISFVY